MVDERESNQNVPVTIAERPQRKITMEEFSIIRDEYFAIRQPAIEVYNFELKPILITMVQQHQFIGQPNEDPNEHLGRFLRMANTVKLNGVNPDVIKLHLFPFSLRDTSASWFEQIFPSCSHFREERRNHCIHTKRI